MRIITTLVLSAFFFCLLVYTSLYHLVVCTGVDSTDYLKGEELHDTIVLWVLFLCFPALLLFALGLWIFRRGVPIKTIEKVVEVQEEGLVYEYNGSDRQIFTKTTNGAYSHTFIRVENDLVFAGYATITSTYFNTASDVVDNLDRLQGKTEESEIKVLYLIKIEKFPLSNLPNDKQILVKCGAINLNTLQSWVKQYK